MKKARSSIAFEDLKSRIITPGFCTSCGACEAACPVRALKIETDKPEQIVDCSQQVEFCPICYDVCPHSESLLMEASSFVSEAPHNLESIGDYRRILLAQASDSRIRELSGGGGVVTAILKESMKQGLIDSAIVSTARKGESLKLKSSISLVPDDLSSVADVEYFPSAAGRAFGEAVHEYGKSKIAFVGTPCQILALRKMESWEHKIQDNVKVIIGLMCLWSFSFQRFIEAAEKTYGVKQEEIKKITLDKKYFIHTKDRVIMIPVTEAKRNMLRGCLSCVDYTSELADLSVGGAYPLEEWSTVIIRTEKGEQFFENAVKNRAVTVKDLSGDPDVFTHLIEMAEFKRRVNLEETWKTRAARKLLPPATLRLMQPTSKELSLLSSLCVKDVMTSKVITASPENTIKQVFEMMTIHHHMAFPVVDNYQQFTGIATFEDVVHTSPDERNSMKISDVQLRNPITVELSDTVLTAYEKMNKNRAGIVAVVDSKNSKKLLGIMTRTDIVQILRWPLKRK